jgi:enoyl-CoA hydratase
MIIFEEKQEAGVITLNRPQALNALTLEMVHQIHAALDRVENSPHLTRVIFKGAGEKAFCAGGDIRALYELGKAGQHEEALLFWHDEYLLNIRLMEFKKPLIALLDGIVMGGGVGLSAPCTYRVAGERYMFAMPEVSIGFFPDVGGGYHLPRLPHSLGYYAALTGERFKQGDALASGLVTHAVASSYALEEKLCSGDIDAVLKAASQETHSPLMAHKGSIQRHFSHNNVDKIYTSLEKDAKLAQDDFAIKTLKTMRAKSPFSQFIAFEQLKRGATMSFREVMVMEYRIVSRIMETADFYEGVRSVIIDKDNAPNWSSSTQTEAYFAPLKKELL